METKRICTVCGQPLAANAPEGLCPGCLLQAGIGSGVDLGAGTETGAHRPAFVPPSVAELAASFPQLEVLELIGQGGMGAVYKARQKKLDRLVALKILPPGSGQEPAFAERFTREAQALAKLNHPGIVTLYEFGETGGQFYFLMEYVDGVNLRQLLHGGRISAREALAIVPQICDALQFAHDQGIVHRDIKPENILLDRRGHVKVADFGLAKIVGRAGSPQPADAPQSEGGAHGVTRPTSLTEASKVMGTPQYMSPEQVQAPGEVDHRADIYALGVVFYQMLTGELPGKKIEAPSKKVSIDVRLDEVVLRALEQKPELRFQQVSEVKTMVEAIATTPASPAGGTDTKKSGMVRMVELFFGIQFASPLAIRLANLSTLGFLGSLCFLSFLPLPGAHPFIAFSSLYGFFGLIGFAFMVEYAQRRRRHGSAQSGGSRREAAQTKKAESGKPGDKARRSVAVLRRRDRWIWDTSNVVLMAFVPFMFSWLLFGSLVMFIGTKALLALIPGGMGLVFAMVYGLVGRRVRALKAQLPKTEAEIAEVLFFERPKETPGIAVLHRDRLELFGIAVIDRLVIQLDEIVSLSEVRMFNSRRLWWKRGFVLDLKNGRRVGVAVPEPFGRRWRSKLSGGTLPELPAVETEKSEIIPHFSRLDILVAVLISIIAAPSAWFMMNRLHTPAAIAVTARSAIEPRQATRERVFYAGPWVAEFPGGGRIELLAVRPNSSTNQPWWQPAGLPSDCGREVQPASQAQHPAGVVAIFREEFPEHPDHWPRANGVWGNNVTFQNGVEGFGPSNQRLPNGLLAMYFDDARTDGEETTLAVKAATAPWQTLCTSTPGLLNSLWPHSAEDRWSFSATLAGDLKVKNPHLTENSHCEYRFAAVDMDGKEYLATETTRSPSGMFSSYEVIFNGLPRKAVREARWEARPFETVEFHHVSLKPGHRTAVAVKDFGGENQSASATPALPAIATSLPFGPVVERVVGCDTEKHLGGINLDTGELFSLPVDLMGSANSAPANHETGTDYFAAKGVNAMGFGNSAVPATDSGLLCINGTFAMPVETMDWDSATAATILAHARNLPTASAPVKDTPEFQKMTVMLWNEDGVLPETYIFHTGAGTAGLLQITGFTENPRGVRLRYKLVQPSAIAGKY